MGELGRRFQRHMVLRTACLHGPSAPPGNALQGLQRASSRMSETPASPMDTPPKAIQTP